jgi:hypothetical protein
MYNLENACVLKFRLGILIRRFAAYGERQRISLETVGGGWRDIVMERRWR